MDVELYPQPKPRRHRPACDTIDVLCRVIANTPEEAERAYSQEFPKWEAMIKSTGVTVSQQ